MLVEETRLFNKIFKLLVELRRASGDIKVPDRRISPENLQTSLNPIPGHHLGPLRTRVHVAMFACLVAELADIHLKGLNCCGFQVKLMSCQRFLEIHHHFGFL